MATHTVIPLGSEPGSEFGYYEFIPDVTPVRIVIGLHGWGHIGNGTTELTRVLNEGLAREIRLGTYDKTIPAIVISLQYGTRDVLNWMMLDRFIKKMCDKYRLPRSKVNMTGISGGGNNMMNYLYNYKAANPVGAIDSVFITRVVAVSSGVMKSMYADKIPPTYLWVAHGTKDTTCKYEEALAVYNAVKEMGGRAKLTYFAWAAHDVYVWNKTYNQREVQDFLGRYS